MKLRKLTLFILVAGFLFASVSAYVRYDSWQQGLRMESSNTASTLLAIPILLGCGGLLAMAGLATPIRAIWKKEFQPLAAAAAAGAFIVGVEFLPIPTHLDGIAEVVARHEEPFYLDLAKQLRELPPPKDKFALGANTVSAGIFARHPGLANIFSGHETEWKRPRFDRQDDYVDIYTGGSMGGIRGVRIYREPGASPYPASGEYVGSFQQIHPRVFAYCRSF